MALNFPYPAVVEDTYVDSNGRIWRYDGTKWELERSTGTRTFNGVKVILETFSALPATPTALDFDNEVYDIGGYYTLLDANRVTINRTGYYRIDGTFYTGAAGTGSSYTFTLVKNGVATLTSQNAAANQSVNYDAILELAEGDYLQVLCSEAGGVGTLLAGSYMQVTRSGLTPGVGITQGDIFSGARTNLTTAVNTTSTPTAISWAGTDHDLNADATGANYWNVNNPSRLTIALTGYYQLKSMIQTGSAGSDDSYTIALKKNGTTTVTSTLLSANDFTFLDEIYPLTAADYLEVYVSNSGSVGTITATANFEVIRLGV